MEGERSGFAGSRYASPQGKAERVAAVVGLIKGKLKG